MCIPVNFEKFFNRAILMNACKTVTFEYTYRFDKFTVVILKLLTISISQIIINAQFCLIVFNPYLTQTFMGFLREEILDIKLLHTLLFHIPNKKSICCCQTGHSLRLQFYNFMKIRQEFKVFFMTIGYACQKQ